MWLLCVPFSVYTNSEGSDLWFKDIYRHIYICTLDHTNDGRTTYRRTYDVQTIGTITGTAFASPIAILDSFRIWFIKGVNATQIHTFLHSSFSDSNSAIGINMCDREWSITTAAHFSEYARTLERDFVSNGVYVVNSFGVFYSIVMVHCGLPFCTDGFPIRTEFYW